VMVKKKGKRKTVKKVAKPTVRDKKYTKQKKMAKALVNLRRFYGDKLKGKGLDRQRVLAGVIAMMDKYYFRIGNIANKNYGLTTLKKSHFKSVTGKSVRISYIGKKNMRQVKTITYAPLVKLLRELYKSATGQGYVFRYKLGNKWYRISSTGVNTFLRKYGITAKDFRTYHATKMMRACVTGNTKQKIGVCVAGIAGKLGNTPGVCKGSYIDPVVYQQYKRKLERLKKKSKKR